MVLKFHFSILFNFFYVHAALFSLIFYLSICFNLYVLKESGHISQVVIY